VVELTKRFDRRSIEASPGHRFQAHDELAAATNRAALRNADRAFAAEIGVEL
jgi:hypothetical protein